MIFAVLVIVTGVALALSVATAATRTYLLHRVTPENLDAPESVGPTD